MFFDLDAIQLLLVIHLYLLLGLALLVLSVRGLLLSRAQGRIGYKRHRVARWLVAIPLALSCLGVLAVGLFAIGLSHGSRPTNLQTLLFIGACLLPVLLLIVWSIGSRWLDRLWLLLLAAGLVYLLLFNPALYLEQWANAGSARAQLWMAQQHESGTAGLEKSPPRARAWYRKAAENGDPVAQFWMGQNSRRLSDSLRWYRLAAAQGHAGAMVLLARSGRDRQQWLEKAFGAGHPEAVYLQAHSLLKQDLPLARRLIHEAADQGSRNAMLLLAIDYLQGGVLFERDPLLAQQWIERLDQTVASPVDPPYLDIAWIKLKLAEAEAQGRRIESGDTQLLYQQAKGFLAHPALDASLRQRAVAYLIRAAGLGHAGSALVLAELEMKQRQLDRPDQEALHWYRRAADLGSQKALEVLVRFYRGLADSTVDDLQRAIQYNLQLLKQLPTGSRTRERLQREHWAGELKDSRKRLARLQRLGGSWGAAQQQAQQDPDKEYLLAKELLQARRFDEGMQRLRSAAERGSPAARMQLAQRVLRGPRSYLQEIEAISELQRLDRDNFLPASLVLAGYYQSGNGIVPRNYHLSRRLFRRAMQQADLAERARRWLERTPSLTDQLQLEQGDPLDQIEQWYQRLLNSGVDRVLLVQQYRALQEYYAPMEALERLAVAGDPSAQYQLAQTLQSHDLVEAFGWLERAAASGLADAQYELAVRMIRGKRNTPEQQRALHGWVGRATESGHVGALVFAAAQYRSGRGGFVQDAGLAREYYQRALDAVPGAILFQGRIAGRDISIRRENIQKALDGLD